HFGNEIAKVMGKVKLCSLVRHFYRVQLKLFVIAFHFSTDDFSKAECLILGLKFIVKFIRRMVLRLYPVKKNILRRSFTHSFNFSLYSLNCSLNKFFNSVV